MTSEPDCNRRLTAYLDWALDEIQRESACGELTVRANELIDHAEAVAQRLGATAALGARFRESMQARH